MLKSRFSNFLEYCEANNNKTTQHDK